MNLNRLLRTPSPVHAFVAGSERLVYGRLSRRRDALVQVEEAPLRAPWFQLGPVGVLHVDREAVEASLKELLGRLEKVPTRASLAVPNSWIRSVMVDVGTLPRHREEAEENLRWRLKKLLPCRPEDVRLDFVSISDNGRVLIMLALERPIAAVEEAFAAAGVSLGRMEPLVLAISPLVPAGRDAVVAAVEEGALGVALVAQGKLRLLREKTLPEGEGRAELFLGRELTRTLEQVREILGEGAAAELWLVAVPEMIEPVQRWAQGASGVTVRRFEVDAGAAPPALAGRIEGLALLGSACVGGV
jgi:hypothetical protein